MRRIDTFIIEIAQYRLTSRVMAYCSHELTMKTLASKCHSSVRCTTTSTKFDIIHIRLGAKLKSHELLMNRAIAYRCKLIAVTQKDILDCRADRKHTGNRCHYTTALPALPNALIFSSTTA
ncbi:hypothetical protein D3C73_1084350 [compost metagenome]